MKSQNIEVSMIDTSKNNTIANNYPQLTKEWVCSVDRVGFSPENTTHGSRLLVKWECCSCSFQWEARVYSRTLKNRGCPTCAKIKRGSHTQEMLTVSHPAIAKLFQKSISIANLKVTQLSAGSDVICEWKCEKEHLYKAKVRALTSKNHACPECVVVGSSSQERNLLSATLKLLRLKYDVKPYKVPNFKYSVDYLNKKHKLIIQFDSQYYHSSPEKMLSDKKNTEILSALGYKVIRVREGNLVHISPLDVTVPKGTSVKDASTILAQHVNLVIKG